MGLLEVSSLFLHSDISAIVLCRETGFLVKS